MSYVSAMPANILQWLSTVFTYLSKHFGFICAVILHVVSTHLTVTEITRTTLASITRTIPWLQQTESATRR